MPTTTPPVCRCPAAPIIKFAPFLSYRRNPVRVQFAWPWLGVLARGQTDREAAPFCAFPPSFLSPPPFPSPAIPKRARSPNGACADDFVPGRALGRALACLTALCRSFPLSCRARTAHLWQVASPQKAPPPFPSLRPCNPLWVQRFKVVQHVKTEDQSPNVPLQRHLELTRTSVWLAFKQAWWIPATRCDPAPSVDLGAGLRVTQLAVPKLCAISLWF